MGERGGVGIRNIRKSLILEKLTYGGLEFSVPGEKREG